MWAQPALSPRSGRVGVNRVDRRDLILIVRMGRFRFLIAGFLLFSMGALFAVSRGAVFDPERFVLGYLVMGLGHLSVSYGNDFFDRESDRFGTPSAIAGGSGVLLAHPELAGAAYRLAVLLVIASLGAGMLYCVLYGAPLAFLAFVIAGNLLGWYYSAPPLRFAARGWGEAATALGIGVMVPGMGYLVAAGTFDTAFAVFTVPLLCYGVYFILSVEIPDREADRRSGKLTLAVMRGTGFCRRMVAFSALLATVWYFMLAVLLDGSPLIVIFSLIPLAAVVRGALPGRSFSPSFSPHAEGNIAALVLFCLLADLSLAWTAAA
jgi:1,4-dihydroxy-2-naphthoate octaprenyltransferase